MYPLEDIAALMKGVMEDNTGAAVALRSEHPVAHFSSEIDPWLNERLSSSVLVASDGAKVDFDARSNAHVPVAAGRGTLRSTSGRLFDEPDAVQASLHCLTPRLPIQYMRTITNRLTALTL